MTHEQKKLNREKRRNRAAALLNMNPSHIRAKVEKPKRGKGAYVRRGKYQEAY